MNRSGVRSAPMKSRGMKPVTFQRDPRRNFAPLAAANPVRIPAEANADSERNAKSIPGRRRTVFGAQRRWHFDCPGSVRLRQGGPVGSGRRALLAEKSGSPYPRVSAQKPRVALLRFG